MEYLIWILPLVVIAALVIALQRKNKAIESLRLQLHTAAAQAPTQIPAPAPSAGDALWDCSNTIHLYASLTMEESSSAAVKEKQAEICRLAESLMDLTASAHE